MRARKPALAAVAGVITVVAVTTLLPTTYAGDATQLQLTAAEPTLKDVPRPTTAEATPTTQETPYRWWRKRWRHTTTPTPTPTPTTPDSTTSPSTDSPTPEPKPSETQPPACASDVSGTWVLQQVTSARQLDNLAYQIGNALKTPGVTGFSLRVPWTLIDGDFSILEKGRALAEKHGVAYSVRFMAGRHTPARITASGPTYTVGGVKIPAPFYASGQPNTVFEREYDAVVAKLAAYSRDHGIALLHLPWYGQDWAELNNGKEVRGASGYSYTVWLTAHKRLIDLGRKHAGDGLAVEWPMSGYGPLQTASRDLTRHVVERFGADSPFVYVQANGWGPNGDWGAPSALVEQQMDAAVWPQPVRRGLQAIQPQDYDWSRLYAILEANDAIYGEVYLPSFSMAHAGQLAQESSDFAATSGAQASSCD